MKFVVIRVCFTLLLLAAGFAHAQQAAIASAHPLATGAGHEILKRGGNAFDAAVAIAAALAVVEPYSSGLGGGGFVLLHRESDKKQVMLDARETAPAGVKREHYFDAKGDPIRNATMRGGTSAGIPGTPAALVHLARDYGRLPLAQTLAPAIRLARDGFAVDNRYARIAQIREEVLRTLPDAARIFLVDDRAPQPGHTLKQPELAHTLERIAAEGAAGFYSGAVAQSLVKAVNAAGGAWQLADLENYRVIERAPVKFTYRGATITTAALPSAGGIALAQSLGMLEQMNEYSMVNARDASAAHTISEILRRAFRDRALYLGDPAYVRVPVVKLSEKNYIKQLVISISPDRATSSDVLGAVLPEKPESGNTTHFSVIDAAGNRVGATFTINWIFGGGLVASGTGVLLNNEMDDFTLRPDLPNSYRLRGSEANMIGPGKRPLSSMTPTFVEDGRGVLILGAPGGSRIVSQVLLGVLDYLGTPEVDVKRIVSLPRYHHQFRPDQIEIEPEGFSAEWQNALKAKGHTLRIVNRKWGNMQAVFKSKANGIMQAANDPRGSDVAWY